MNPISIEGSEQILYIIEDDKIIKENPLKIQKETGDIVIKEKEQKEKKFHSQTHKNHKFSLKYEEFPKIGQNEYPKSFTYKNPVEKLDNFEEIQYLDGFQQNPMKITNLDEDLLKKIEALVNIKSTETFEKKDNLICKSNSFSDNEVQNSSSDNLENDLNQNIQVKIEDLMNDMKIIDGISNEENDKSQHKHQNKVKQSIPSKTLENSTNKSSKNNMMESTNINEGDTLTTKTKKTAKSENKPINSLILIEKIGDHTPKTTSPTMIVPGKNMPRKSLLKCQSFGRNEKNQSKKKVKFKEVKNNKK